MPSNLSVQANTLVDVYIARTPGVLKCFSGFGLLSILATKPLSFLGGTREKVFVWSLVSMETDPPTPNPSTGAEVCGRVGCVEVFVALLGWPEAGDSFF